MKTYGKEKPCRLCLRNENIDVVALSSATREIIQTTVGIYTEVGDGLPSRICTDCSNFLKEIVSFKEMCKNSDEWLREKYKKKLLEQDVSSESQIGRYSHKMVQTEEGNSAENYEKIVNEAIGNNVPDSVANVEMFETGDEADVIISPDGNYTFEMVDNSAQSVQSDGNNKNPECPHCKKQFSTRFAMLKHLFTHTGTKECFCPVCGAGFSHPAGLQRHSWTHQAEKPLLCQYCGKRFIQKSNLLNHQRIHSDNPKKPFECNICFKTFKFTSSLSRHSLFHKGVRYTCDVCKKDFNDFSACKRHIALHFKEENELNSKSISALLSQQEVNFKNKTLLAKTKSWAEKNNYKYVWLKNKSVCVRKSEKTPVIRINSVSDLRKKLGASKSNSE